jgi:hypothetical protein
VLFLVKTLPLGRRIQRIAAAHGGAARTRPIRVLPWPGLVAGERQALADGLTV